MDIIAKLDADTQAVSNGLKISISKQIVQCINVGDNQKEVENLKGWKGLL